jgi:hypothetical protein
MISLIETVDPEFAVVNTDQSVLALLVSMLIIFIFKCSGSLIIDRLTVISYFAVLQKRYITCDGVSTTIEYI